jgi:hemerythrin superfamily protein
MQRNCRAGSKDCIHPETRPRPGNGKPSAAAPPPELVWPAPPTLDAVDPTIDLVRFAGSCTNLRQSMPSVTDLDTPMAGAWRLPSANPPSPEKTMPATPRKTPSRTRRAAPRSARSRALAQLKNDHRRVKKAYRDFKLLDRDTELPACAAIVQQVLDELTVHAALEEEILYPAARAALEDEALIDEAEIEHESMHQFIHQLRNMEPDTERYAARFTVLCEYVLHHVKEEENEIFPQLELARMDWDHLVAAMDQRRAQLAPVMPAGRNAQKVENEDTEARVASLEHR